MPITAAAAASSSPGGHRPAEERRVRRARRDAGRRARPATTPDRRWRRSQPAATRAFLSSGTWSLLGTEVRAPVITARSRELNFTNEGGVCGTTRLLKNIGGLWLLQACRRRGPRRDSRSTTTSCWRRRRDDGWRSGRSFDPDHRGVLPPARHGRRPSPRTAADRHSRCRHGPAGYTRAILESLAFKYRVVLESLEELTGSRFTRCGSSAADRATGCSISSRPTRRAGPSSPGRSKPPRSATSRCRCSPPARSARSPRRGASSNDRSRSSGSTRVATDRWDAHYRRFQQYVELMCV